MNTKLLSNILKKACGLVLGVALWLPTMAYAQGEYTSYTTYHDLVNKTNVSSDSKSRSKLITDNDIFKNLEKGNTRVTHRTSTTPKISVQDNLGTTNVQAKVRANFEPQAINSITTYRSTEEICQDGHWRELAYNTKIMSRYKKYAHCVAWTAYQFELPEELLYSIIYVERGDINGKCMTNKNGTEDCGPAQINDVRLGEIKQHDLNKGDMRNNPCRNIWAMGFLIRREIEKANQDFWKGVGNYHYHYSVNQSIHAKYVNRIRDAWLKLMQIDKACQKH